MTYSSEATKKGINPDDINKMTKEEREKFIASLDPDSMGFDGHEGMLAETGE